MNTPVPSRSLAGALLLGFTGFTIWTLGDSAIRTARDYPPLQISFLCGLYSLALMVAFSSYFGGFKATFTRKCLGLQILRGLTMAASTIATVYAFMHLEMPTAFAIIFLSPIAAKLLSSLINREKIPLRMWLVSLLAFAGVLLVIRPGFHTPGIGEMAALTIPLFFGLAFVLSRTIGEDNQTMMSSNLYCDVFLIIGLAVPTYLHFEAMEPVHFLLMAGTGITGGLGTVLVSKAYARAPTAYVAPLHYTQIVWGVIWSVLFFNEYPDAWTLAGAAVIIGAGLMLVWMSRRA